MIQAEAVRELYTYNSWANERLWSAVEDLSEAQLNEDLLNGIGSIQATLLHVVSGFWIWRMRWQGDMPDKMLQVQDFPTLQSIRLRWEEEERQVSLFLAGLQDADLVREIRYFSTANPGKVFVLPLWKMMIHQLNHQTQHRSEIAMRLTALNHSPGELGMSTFFNR